MVKIYTYQNKRNDSKYLEVHYYKCSHYAWKQYLNVNKGNNIYVVGATLRNPNGRLSRINKKTMIQVLEDYDLLEVKEI